MNPEKLPHYDDLREEAKRRGTSWDESLSLCDSGLTFTAALLCWLQNHEYVLQSFEPVAFSAQQHPRGGPRGVLWEMGVSGNEGNITQQVYVLDMFSTRFELFGVPSKGNDHSEG